VANPLVDDRDVAFILDDVLDVARLCELPAFADHTPETFDLVIDSARRLAREQLYPTYRAMDQEPPVFDDGRVRVHKALQDLVPRMAELGLISAIRPEAVGGMQLPLSVAVAAQAYLMAANASAYGYVGLTAGAAHLIEEYGDDDLRALFMARMYAGEWLGTMALTEPDAGSSLGDITTSASPRHDGTYAIRGAKIFISGGDHQITDNIVHLALARIQGAPAGTRGISLFAVPRLRPEHGDPTALVDNDVRAAGMVHKIGWKGIPSLVLSLGEGDNCHGWLVGQPGRGLTYMFQMMNEARIMVGVNGVATASVAFHESLAYARERPQGRPPAAKDPTTPQVAIMAHPDVRRMLLRQKAIVTGGLTLVVAAARYSDLANHGDTEAQRHDGHVLLDLLTPIAKSFPAEYGYESNVLAVQVHGGYGYSSEYLPESWLRDQKLNSIHEGTTGIQSLDLLGRKVMADGGAAIVALAAVVERTAERAVAAGVDRRQATQLRDAMQAVATLTTELGQRGAAGDIEGMLRHSVDYLDLLSIVVVAWLHLERAAAARQRATRLGSRDGFIEGVLATTDYWFATDLPRVDTLVARIRSGEDSFVRMRSEWF